jgi:hypothetical protein
MTTLVNIKFSQYHTLCEETPFKMPNPQNPITKFRTHLYSFPIARKKEVFGDPGL